MSTTVIQFPEVRVGQLRAVEYGAQQVTVYDTMTNERQAVWCEVSLEKAQSWMEALAEYLNAAGAHKANATRKTLEYMEAAFLVLPTHSQGAALRVAKARGLV